MSFPDTRQTFIHRLASQQSDQDWHLFFTDYWPAVYRFALCHNRITVEDAEDIASLTFEALLKNRLLARWVSTPSSKLRTLICSVVRKVMANRARVQKGRQRRLREDRALLKERLGVPVGTALDASAEEVDVFYAGWVDEMVQQAVEALLAEYFASGKGDYFRVLYGRLCEGMTMLAIAQSLEIKQSQAENFYKHARTRLTKSLEHCLRVHVERYTRGEDVETEFPSEWNQLGQFLKDHGGLERAVARAYEQSLSPQQKQTMTTSMHTVLLRAADRRSEGTQA